MFTPDQRDRLRSELLSRAAADSRISGAAITGSAAAGCEDRWSDIDLAFGIADPARIAEVMKDWTAHMYHDRGAVHHLDVPAGSWIYRVFLLPGTLQVDLAFVAAAEFRPMADTFRLVSGSAQEARAMPPADPSYLAGMGWLYALHARTSIARGRLWQAEYMLSGTRDFALALACLRHGLAAVHGRGLHRLPPEIAVRFEPSLVRKIDRAEILRAFEAVIANLIDEIRAADAALAELLEAPLDSLVQSLKVHP